MTQTKLQIGMATQKKKLGHCLGLWNDERRTINRVAEKYLVNGN
jgi:hypothetical protein